MRRSSESRATSCASRSSRRPRTTCRCGVLASTPSSWSRNRRRSSARIATSWIGPSCRSKPSRVSLRSLDSTSALSEAALAASSESRSSTAPSIGTASRRKGAAASRVPGCAVATRAASGCCQRPTDIPSNSRLVRSRSGFSPEMISRARSFAPREGLPWPTWQRQLICSVSSSAQTDALRSGAKTASIASCEWMATAGTIVSSSGERRTSRARAIPG